MRLELGLLLICLCPCLSLEELCPLLRASGSAQEDLTGCYVVVLGKNITVSAFEDVQSKILSLSDDFRVYSSIQNIIKAITVKINETSLNIIRSISEVEYVEEETRAKGMQYIPPPPPPWHLDRLDQNSIPLDSQYLPLADGKDVDIYILDSGINFSHEEFENRAKYSGFDPTDRYHSENHQGMDCHGHGTHVASLAAGKTFGVAKGARLYSVRVLGCDNSGPWSVVLEGLDYVSRVVPERGRPAIVSLSLGGDYFKTVNDAIRELYFEGIFSASAAGNEFNDACIKSPASSPFTTTVGGTRDDDDIYGSTNFGHCVDIFAPGEDIKGANYNCSTCYKFLSGTSMATPMVSGAAAILLSHEPLLSPGALQSKLLYTAVRNKLSFRRIPMTHRDTTANLLLHTTGQCGGYYTTPAILVSPNYPHNYPHNLDSCQWIISAVNSGDVVECNFTDFYTEAKYDIVTVCDGSYCCLSSSLVSLSGEVRGTSTYVSTEQTITLKMTSDGIINHQGFRVTCHSKGYTPAITAPPITAPPITAPPITAPPITAPPITAPPITAPPITAPPITAPPITAPATTALPITAPPITTPPITAPPSAMPPTTEIETTGFPVSMNATCDGNLPNHQIPIIVSDIIGEASAILQELVAQSLTGLLESKVLGQLEDYPASSCLQLASIMIRGSPLKSGYYWLRSVNGTSVRAYCDLHSLGGVDVGFMQVAHLDMTQLNHTCPSSLAAVNACGKRLCGRGSPSPGCSSVFYSTFGLPYSRICGSVIGYQFSSPNAFFAHQIDPRVSIDEPYLDGVSLTYGSSPRNHIWSFAAAIDESTTRHSICPCTNIDHSLPPHAVPPFVKSRYFCDTSNRNQYESETLICDDPLWDGKGCGSNSTCCQQQSNSPWFCVELDLTTEEEIEVRLCGNEGTWNEDTPIESIQLYVQ